MNRQFSYQPKFNELTQACARLRRGMRARGRDVAAYHVPTRMLRAIFGERSQELLTMFGVPVYGHDGSGGIVAEKGRMLREPCYSLDWREA